MRFVRFSLSITVLFSTFWLVTALMTVGTQGSSSLMLSARANTVREQSTLTVTSFNIAHGRADGFTQLLMSKDTIQQNLDAVANVLQASQADIIALQEIEAASSSNGQVDQSAYLGQQLAIENRILGQHVQGLGVAYGTALLSRLPLSAPLSHRFEPNPPALCKGFVVASIVWPGSTQVVDFVSLHLDFALEQLREKQIQELISTLKTRAHPVVIMGDFNTDANDQNNALNRLQTALQLKSYAPNDQSLITFPTLDKRLDWILVSPSITFTQYRVLPDVVSDHLATVAELSLIQ